jgi:hypothetical protein
METLAIVFFCYVYLLGTVAAVFFERIDERKSFFAWFISLLFWWIILPTQLWAIRQTDVDGAIKREWEREYYLRKSA